MRVYRLIRKRNELLCRASRLKTEIIEQAIEEGLEDWIVIEDEEELYKRSKSIHLGEVQDANARRKDCPHTAKR